MKIVDFQPEHAAKLKLQEKQTLLSPWLEVPAYTEALSKLGPAYSVIDGDSLIACAGSWKIHPGRQLLWAMMAEDCGRRFVTIHRAVQRFLEAQEGRIEVNVNVDFPEAIRWVEMLGFEREGLMRAYTHDGRDQYLYARINPWRR